MPFALLRRDGEDMNTTLHSKNVTIDGRRTSLRLENEIWEALSDICLREKMSVHELCSLVEKRRHGSSRTSAVRTFVVAYFRTAAGMAKAGKGSMAPYMPVFKKAPKSVGAKPRA